MTSDVTFKDFSLPPKPIVMRIDPDDFKCLPEIPLDVMMEVAAFATSNVTGMDRFKQLLDLFSGVIEPLDYEKFIARTKRGTVAEPNLNPIGMRHIRDILPWVMEVYGLRPTQESSESADGSLEASTSSMEPASDEA
jgi:hypothetical protein